MTPEQAREAAAVMLEFADGKKIECKTATGPDPWVEVAEPCWEWDCMKYRVAPWEGKIWVSENGSIREGSFYIADPSDSLWRLITAKEVIH